jgi:hypothetical protein
MNAARPARLLFVLAALMLGGCATQKHSRDLLQVTLYDYESAIRWGDFGGAARFLDPESPASKKLTPVDMKRYEQVQVTGYYDQAGAHDAEGSYRQVVEIRMVNRHTQAERSVIDRQHWRYDAEARVWRLASGLPDITGK